MQIARERILREVLQLQLGEDLAELREALRKLQANDPDFYWEEHEQEGAG